MNIYFNAKRNIVSGYTQGELVTLSGVEFSSFDENYEEDKKSVRLRNGEENNALIWYKKQYSVSTTAIDPAEMDLYRMFSESVIGGETFIIQSPDYGDISVKVKSPPSFSRVGFRINLFTMSMTLEGVQ